MSVVTIKRVSGRKELKTFIRFNYELYKDCPCAVPDFLEDTLDTFNPKKNPAFEFCEAEFFLAMRDGRIVGRIAVIINHKANETWGTRNARFGWIDFVDDPEVSRALMDTAEQWARDHGMDALEGPLGFTDMDPEGMLTGGYDQLSTMATIYNYPYYPVHMEKLGYEKEVDWVERKITVPTPGHEAHMDKYFRVAEISAGRYNLRVKKFKHVSEIRRDGYAYRIFRVVNEAYAPLFGYTKMNERQIDQYVNMYLPLIDLRLLTVIETAEGEPVAMGVGMPSLSRAIQKAKARLFPFGWIHLLKALFIKHSEIADMLLVAVLPEYQNKGVNAMIFADLIPVYQQMGFKYAETHPQLETNEKSQGQWAYLEAEVHKHRRCYKKIVRKE
ncbi:MAG: GNAT family N-acetyltransferase [Paraprevotella sp.]|nr:GNAT family N-acetyltransferase [Paraprevotella sp.]MBP3471685.1 GNAT family N-acetyltransferase [Paraprevotella sp.]